MQPNVVGFAWDGRCAVERRCGGCQTSRVTGAWDGRRGVLASKSCACDNRRVGIGGLHRDVEVGPVG